MSDPPKRDDDSLTRRELTAAGVSGAAVLAALPVLAASSPGGGLTKRRATRMPVVFLPHGGGPWPFVDLGFPQAELDSLSTYLRQVRELPKVPPKALVVVSAHWEESVPTVMTSEKPPMLYDYSGFPPESYRVTWPAPGSPALAARVRALLSQAGFKTGEDAQRGFDHGTFVPLKLTYPEADVPVVQLSLKRGLDPAEHLAMGRALAPLRDEGIFIIGSGMTFHNLRAFGAAQAKGPAVEFDTWLQAAVTASPSVRDERLAKWMEAPHARFIHPREEHLLPLMVVAGAAGEDLGLVTWAGTVMGMKVSGYHFG